MTSVVTNDCSISATNAAEIERSLVITLVIGSERVNHHMKEHATNLQQDFFVTFYRKSTTQKNYN